MRPKVEEEEPIRDEPMIDELPMDPYHVMARRYDDDVGRGLNYVGYSLEGIMCHLAIIPSVRMPDRYTYIPTWEESWANNHGGAGISGAGDRDDEEED